MRPRTTFFLVLAILLAISLPYIFGFSQDGGDFVFGGFLLNPLDGNSYLAKMRIGLNGDWLFQLPFTAEPGDGGYLFLFYIFLGHLARWIHLDPIWVFHIARLICSAFLMWTVYKFIQTLMIDQKPFERNLAYLWVVIGSGLGWVAAVFGGFTSDFWVAEAFPFLSMYSNPHFPLGLGILLLYLRTLVLPENNPCSYVSMLILGVMEGIILPFGIVVAGGVSLVVLIWNWIETKKIYWVNPLLFIAGGGVLVVYQYAITLADPVLRQWNAQNVTPAPSILDLLISFSPAILPALGGVAKDLRTGFTSPQKILVSWLFAGAILTFIPLNLQRRFLLGYYIPVAILAVQGLIFLVNSRKSKIKLLGFLLVILSFLTNGVILGGGIAAISNRDTSVFLYRAEKQAFTWMNQLADNRPLILASPEVGQWIPAYTNWRVLYGHPFETVDAQKRQSELNTIFIGQMDPADFHSYLEQHQVQFVFWGPREQKRYSGELWDNYQVVYQNNLVAIYKTDIAP